MSHEFVTLGTTIKMAIFDWPEFLSASAYLIALILLLNVTYKLLKPALKKNKNKKTYKLKLLLMFLAGLTLIFFGLSIETMNMDFPNNSYKLKSVIVKHP